MRRTQPPSPPPLPLNPPWTTLLAGVTGGLAAPLVAAGAATIIGSAGAAALGSVAGIAVMTSLFGAAGAGLTGKRQKCRQIPSAGFPSRVAQILRGTRFLAQEK